MSLGTDLAAAAASINVDSALLRAIVQGPAGGGASLVAFPNGAVIKTLARIAQEVTGGYLPLAGGLLTGPLHLSSPLTEGGAIWARSTGSYNSISVEGVNGPSVNDTAFIKFTDGVNATFLGLTGTAQTAGRLRFVQGGAEKIGISSTVRINAPLGIGKTPAYSLDVEGSIIGLGAAGSGYAYLQLGASSTPANNWSAGSEGDGNFCVYRGNMGSGTLFLLLNATELSPGTDNGQTLGKGAKRWGTIYSGTGTINTSGREFKESIHCLGTASLESGNPEEVKAAKRLRVGARLARRISSWQFKDSIQEKGLEAFNALSPEARLGTTVELEGKKLARYHIGLVFDEVVAACEAEGLDPLREGMICRDKRMVPVTVSAPIEEQEELDVPDDGFDIVVEGGQAIRRVRTGTRKEKQWIALPLFDGAGQPVMIPTGRMMTGLPATPELVQATHRIPKMVTRTVDRVVEEWDGTYVDALRENHCYALALAALAHGVVVED